MNNYKNIYKLIDGLNNKIKKLESYDANYNKLNNNNSNITSNIKNYCYKQEKTIDKNQNQNQNQNTIISNTLLESYRIHHSEKYLTTKKYVGLLFDNNFNNFDSDGSSGNKQLNSFIGLRKSNIILSYSLQLELSFTPITSIICSFSLGIKSKSDPKIKIIKGTKHQFDLANSNIVNGHIIVSNTTIYLSNGDEELCMIGDFGSNCKVNPKKSLIKLLYV